MSTENLESANQAQSQAQYQAGKRAFESGEYRRSIEYLETAISLSNPNSPLGGEMQTWLVTAYQAAGQVTEAIALCEQLGQHPDLKTRQQGSRLLYILKAPELKPRPEWLSQIPDLTALGEDKSDLRTSRYVSPAPKPLRQPDPEPLDPSQINTKDNQFVWVALAGSLLIATALFWLSR